MLLPNFAMHFPDFPMKLRFREYRTVNITLYMISKFSCKCFLWLMLAAVALCFQSCSEDDSPRPEEGLLAGPKEFGKVLTDCFMRALTARQTQMTEPVMTNMVWAAAYASLLQVSR